MRIPLADLGNEVDFDYVWGIVLKQNILDVKFIAVLERNRHGAEVRSCGFCVADTDNGIRFTLRQFKIALQLIRRVQLSFPFDRSLLIQAFPGNRIHDFPLFTIEFCCKTDSIRVIEVGFILFIEGRTDNKLRIRIIAVLVLQVADHIMHTPTGCNVQFSTIADFTLPVVNSVLLPNFVKTISVHGSFDAVNQVIAV